MMVSKGFEHSIAHFNSLEQQFILAVAKRLEHRNFPLHTVTHVYLKQPINSASSYYNSNEITFLINLPIYPNNSFYWSIENIGIGWEHPDTERHPDGSVTFTFGKKVDVDALEMVLYRLKDSYNYPLQLQNNNVETLKAIDIALKDTSLDAISLFAHKGLIELSKNYHIVFVQDKANSNIYEMHIKRLGKDIINTNHFHELYLQYKLRVNTISKHIDILKCFDTTFFPTPSSIPITIRPKKAKD